MLHFSPGFSNSLSPLTLSNERGITDTPASITHVGQCLSIPLQIQVLLFAAKGLVRPTRGVSSSCQVIAWESEWIVGGSLRLNRLCARAWRGTAPIPTITRFLEKSWRQLTVIAHSEWMTANPDIMHSRTHLFKIALSGSRLHILIGPLLAWNQELRDNRGRGSPRISPCFLPLPSCFSGSIPPATQSIQHNPGARVWAPESRAR